MIQREGERGRGREASTLELWVVPFLFSWLIWCILGLLVRQIANWSAPIDECLTVMKQHFIVGREREQKSETLYSCPGSVIYQPDQITQSLSSKPALSILKGCKGQTRSCHCCVASQLTLSPMASQSQERFLHEKKVETVHIFSLSLNFIADISVLRNFRSIVENKLL